MRASLMTALALGLPSVLGAQDTVRVRADAPPRWGPAPRLVEVLRIGQLDGPPEYAFGNLLHVAVAPDGSFFTYDQDDRQIRAYDATGRFVALVGRSGKGPGEYEHVAAMGVNRESLLVVHDPNSARITYFDRMGKLRRSHPIDAIAFYGHGVLLDTADRIYLHVSLPGGPAEGEGSRHQFRRYRGERAVDSVSIPTSSSRTRSFVLLTTDGMRYAFSGGTPWSIYQPGGVVSTPAGLNGFVIDTGGSRVLRVERPAQPVAVGREERAEWEAKGAFMTRSRGGPVYSIPSTKPFVRAVRSDDRGRVWVEVYVAAEKRTNLPPLPADRGPQVTWRERTTYDVYDRDGTYLGRIALPPESRLLTIRGDRIWVNTSAASGEDQLVVYALPTSR